jgi:hypothetical protein
VGEILILLQAMIGKRMPIDLPSRNSVSIGECPRNAEKLLRLGVNADEPHCRVPGGLGIEDIVTHIQRDVAQLLVTPDTLFFDSAEEFGPMWYHEPYFLAAMEYLAERHNVAVILSAQRAEALDDGTVTYYSPYSLRCHLGLNQWDDTCLIDNRTGEEGEADQADALVEMVRRWLS